VHLGEQALEVGAREVRAAVERVTLGRGEHRHRPAALVRHGLRGAHVDGVHVGPLLAVDLDVDEVLVHQPRGLGVLEALVGHDVAPVDVKKRVTNGRMSTPH
jgi:hypothetical protein